jgi:hypothetical protein
MLIVPGESFSFQLRRGCVTSTALPMPAVATTKTDTSFCVSFRQAASSIFTAVIIPTVSCKSNPFFTK